MMDKKQIRKAEGIFLGVAAFAFGAIMTSLILSNGEESVPHRNLVDLQMSQYSDKNINQSAIATNLKFKDLAFETGAAARPSFVSNQFAAVIKTVRSLINAHPKQTMEPKEYGTWVWTPVMQMTPDYMEEIILGAKKDGINVIYLSVDSYLDIFTMEKGETREAAKLAFSKRLENFIWFANKNGIEVDAEAGWRNWAERDNVYKAFAVVNYVKNFNETHDEKFRGFQYDVEPYLLDEYKKDPSPVLKDFVKLVDETEEFLGSNDLKFSVVIPDFYDEKDDITPTFVYDGAKESVFKHLLNILDRRFGSEIIVMSYRNFADGKDGAIEISRNEMNTADRGSYNTRIIIAQETGAVPPPYVTYHDTSKKYLLWQIGKINSAFNSYENFGGIAIHYANAFLALK